MRSGQLATEIHLVTTVGHNTDFRHPATTAEDAVGREITKIQSVTTVGREMDFRRSMTAQRNEVVA